MSTNKSGYETKEVNARPHSINGVLRGFIVEVFILHHSERKYEPPKRKKIGQYAFASVNRETIADQIRGDIPENDGHVVIYIGNTLGKHYYTSHSHSDIPVAVFEKLREKNITLLENVDGGWSDWGGRPEWSKTYIDFEDSSIVNMDTFIEDRSTD